VPVVTLHCLAPDDPAAVDRALHALVAGIAAATGGAPAGTWAHWVPMARVVQGGSTVGYAGHCPVVTIRGRARDADAVRAAVRAAAVAASDALGLPLEDVWVQWVDVEPGRAFAGGDLV
jgi:hypothetical protein